MGRALRAGLGDERPAAIGDLFAEHALYHPAPDTEPWRDRDGIVAGWLERKDEREPGFRYEVLAVAATRICARMDPLRRATVRFQQLWVIRFDAAGRCVDLQNGEWSTASRTRRRAEGERMNAAEREALIDQYEDGFRAVSAALEAITEAELEAREAPGEWSSREIVHHLADSEMTSAIRLRLLIAEDAPTLLGYDQEAFVRHSTPTARSDPHWPPSKPRGRRRLRSCAVSARSNGGGPARTARAVATRSKTGYTSTVGMPTTTAIRSAGRELRWGDRRAQRLLRRRSQPAIARQEAIAR